MSHSLEAAGPRGVSAGKPGGFPSDSEIASPPAAAPAVCLSFPQRPRGPQSIWYPPQIPTIAASGEDGAVELTLAEPVQIRKSRLCAGQDDGVGACEGIAVPNVAELQAGLGVEDFKLVEIGDVRKLNDGDAAGDLDLVRAALVQANPASGFNSTGFMSV